MSSEMYRQICRVLIADDHQLVRAGIRRLMDSIPGIEVVAEARDGAEAFELIALHRPDIALLDLSMPLKNGLEVTVEVVAQFPQTAVIIMSVHADLDHAREALARGARGFLAKDSAPGELELALRSSAAGHIFLSPQISALMVDSLLHRGNSRGAEALTQRQREILTRIGHGQSTKQIAAELNLSVKTVETHRARMMETLGIRRANELLRYAINRQSAPLV